MENGQPGSGRSPLDTMQGMLNASLETIGRVIAEANQGAGKDRAIAAASRLRTVLPPANDNFQVALDDLEHELRIARWTLRRDLLRLRESQAQPTSETNGMDSTLNGADIDMQDMMETDAPATSTAATNGTEAAALKDQDIPADTESPVKANPDLSIDTSAPSRKASRADTAEPPTAGMSIADFDSLFNDPDSARVSLTGSPAVLEDTSQPTQAEAATAPAAVPADDANEDLSSLLPGLESYANAADGMIDLSTPVVEKASEKKANEAPQNGTANGSETQQSGEGPGEEEERDTTFDDLMNFGDFDMGDFGNGGFDDGGGGSAFDDNYFNLD